MLDREALDQVISFVVRETRKGTPKRRILATLEILVDAQAQRDIEESLKNPGKIFLSARQAAKYFRSL